MIQINETKLRKIIREQLLLEFSLGWFVTRNSMHLTKLIFAEELPEMIEAVESIRSYYSDGEEGCDEMSADLKEIRESNMLTKIINAAISFVEPIKPELIKDQKIEEELFMKLFNTALKGCNEDVKNQMKSLVYTLIGTFAEKVEDSQIAADYNQGKAEFLNV